ncbi:MAG: hypothetical protein V5A46_10285 [Haloferacaceae archaeon]
MVEVTYYCPYCGAVTGVERDGYLRDDCVTREPLEGWEYADPIGDVESADGIEFVCLGDETGGEGEGGGVTHGSGDPSGDGPDGPQVDRDGCGRTFYLNFLRYENGEPVSHRSPSYDRPRFDFRR